MASVAAHLIEEVTAHAQSDSLDDAREIWADGTYFLYNPRSVKQIWPDPDYFANKQFLWSSVIK